MIDRPKRRRFVAGLLRWGGFLLACPNGTRCSPFCGGMPLEHRGLIGMASGFRIGG